MLSTLAMRGWAVRRIAHNPKQANDAAIGLFERALAVDPQVVRRWSAWLRPWPIGCVDLQKRRSERDIVRAEDWAERAVVAQPDNSAAHTAKAYGIVRQAAAMVASHPAEAETGIADNSNNAEAHRFSLGCSTQLCLGRGEDGSRGSKPHFPAKPRDQRCVPAPSAAVGLRTSTPFLAAQWEQGGRMVRQARVAPANAVHASISRPPTPGPATTSGGPGGRDRNCRESPSRLHRADLGRHPHADDPTFKTQVARIADGLRKAGLPEE